MEMRRIILTEEVARQLLSNNKNRYKAKGLERQGRRFCDIILAGRWVESPSSPFLVDKEGCLRDGQSRCTGVIQAASYLKATEQDPALAHVPVWIATDVPAEAQLTADTSSRRLFSHWLEINDVPGSRNIAAVVILHWRYEHGLLLTKASFNTSLRIEHQDLWEHYCSRPGDFQEAARTGSAVRKASQLPATVASTATLILSDLPEYEPGEIARDIAGFWDQVCMRGTVPVVPGSGPALLRGYAENRLRAKEHGTARTVASDNQDWLALTFKAWNMYRKGETGKFVRWRTGGSGPERFPVPE